MIDLKDYIKKEIYQKDNTNELIKKLANQLTNLKGGNKKCYG